jgi:hypothetical protein
MSCLYVVRCNFSDPAASAGWQRWYSGEKQDWLLSRPGFLAGQRFSALRCTDGVEFVALYALDSPAALETPEYRSGWGWGRWRPYIADWSRNFFEGIDPGVFLTADAEFLRAGFVGPAGDADAAAAAYPELNWVRAQPGLDASLSALGLARTANDVARGPAPGPGIAQGLFRPVSPARYSTVGVQDRRSGRVRGEPR